MKSLPTKCQGETITVKWNFLGIIPYGETISSAQVVITQLFGSDPQPQVTLISGSVSISTPVVSQKITDGWVGSTYRLKCLATTNTGKVYEDSYVMTVVPNVGTMSTSSPLTLSGTLANPIIGNPYSQTLTIAGGVTPYQTVSISSGSAPAWAAFAIVGNTVTVTGTPDEYGTFTFTVTVRDFAGNRANSPQQFINSVPTVVWNGPFGWTTYNDADAGSAGDVKPIYSLTLQRTAVFGGNFPKYTSDGGLTLSQGTPLTNGGDGDWSPTLGKAMIVRSNTDRIWSSSDMITYTNHLQPVNLPSEPPVCWAQDRLEFGILCVSGPGPGNALWARSTTGNTLVTSTITTNLPVNMTVMVRALGKYYFAFANNTPAATNRIAYGPSGQDDWNFLSNIDTSWMDAKYVPTLGKVFACGRISGVPASRKVISIDPTTLTVTDITPASLPGSWHPTGIAYSIELGLLVLTGELDAGSGNTSFFTSTNGASSASWTERTLTFPCGNFHKLAWQGPPFYRFITLRSGGLRGDGVAYSNTVLVP